MDITKLPEKLTYNQVKALRAAFGHFYDEEQGTKFVDKQTGFRFENVTKFVDYLYSPGVGIPKGTSAKVIGITLESWYETLSKAPEFSESTMTEAPEYAASSNTLTPERLAQLQEEENEKAESFKKSQAEAKAAIEASIKKQQELYDKESAIAKQAGSDLKEKKIYIKVEKTDVAKTEKVEKLRQQAKADPQAFVNTIEKVIKNRVPNIPELAAKQASYDIVQNLQTDSFPSIQTAVISTLALNTKQIDNVIKNTPLASNLKNWLQVLSDEKLTGQELSRAVTRAAFGDLFQKEVLPDFAITFSDTPQESFKEFGLDQISTDYSSLMSRQGSFLEGLKDFGVEKVRAHILSKVNSFITEQIEKLPTDSAFRGVFSSEIVQNLLPAAGLGVPAVWQAVEGSFFGKIAVSSGFAPVLGWLGEKTGIDFGIKKVVQLAAEKGVEGATGVGLAGAITAAFAWTGPFAPIIGAVGAFLIEVIGAKIINKVVDWIKSKAPQIKQWSAVLIGAVVGLIALPFVGMGAALGISIGTVAVSAGLGAGVGGLTLGGIGAGIAGLFGALGGAFLGAIAMPILITLLVFPVVVALILFIINSGAYIVPTGVSGSPVGCTPQSTQIVQRASTLAGNLKLGFNRYYNNSPDYPELWNAALFARLPNPVNQEASIGAQDMFWCNYMATKSFEAGNENIPFPLPTMISYFQNQQRWVNGPTATYNDVCPGDAIFFYNSFDPPGSISHVGIVASVSADGITTFESNAPWKGWLYPTDTSGHFETTNSLNIIGFGRP